MDPISAVRRRITATLFIAQSLHSAAMIASFTLLPILAAELGGSDGVAGVPSTLGLFGRALAAYPIGWLMDRAGRRVGLALGYSMGAFGMALTAWAILSSSFTRFLVGTSLFGMSRGASEQGRYVAGEVQRPEQRAKAIGWIVFAGTIGAVGGPLLVEPSGLVAARLGLFDSAGPFLLGAVLMAGGVILIWTLLRPDPLTLTDQENRPTPAAQTRGAPLLQLFNDSKVLLALSAMTIGQLVMTLIMVITPLHMNHQHHATREISLVIMAHTLGMFGLSWLTGWLIDRYGRFVMIFGGAIVFVVAGVLTPLSTSVLMLAVALFLLGLGWNFSFVAGSSLLTDAVPASDQGRVQGSGEVVVALASGAGSLGSGVVFAGGGIYAVSGVALAMVLALLGGAAWFGLAKRTSIEPV